MSPLYVGLLQVPISLFVAIITAYITVFFSLRRFYREKWWEAKMRAYTDVIQALHNMKRDLEISLQAEMEGRNTDTDYHKEWEKKHRAAWDEVRKQIDVGEFLYSPTSVEILQSLLAATKSDPNDMYTDHLERLQIGVERCMPALKAAARIDLGLSPLRPAK